MVLTGCAQSGASGRPSVYDFGPGALRTAPANGAATPSTSAPIVVAEVEASPALDSTAVLYRLAYADDQQLKAYVQARWSMTPAQLVHQRLREHLGQRRTLAHAGDSPLPPITLQLALEEFSQLFETPDTSVGLLRLSATLTQTRPGGEKRVLQHSVTVQRPAPSADAPGGVRALTAATDAAVLEIDAWLRALAP